MMYEELTDMINNLDHSTPIEELSKKGIRMERNKLAEILKWCKSQRSVLNEQRKKKYAGNR